MEVSSTKNHTVIRVRLRIIWLKISQKEKRKELYARVACKTFARGSNDIKCCFLFLFFLNLEEKMLLPKYYRDIAWYHKGKWWTKNKMRNFFTFLHVHVGKKKNKVLHQVKLSHDNVTPSRKGTYIWKWQNMSTVKSFGDSLVLVRARKSTYLIFASDNQKGKKHFLMSGHGLEKNFKKDRSQILFPRVEAQKVLLQVKF